MDRQLAVPIRGAGLALNLERVPELFLSAGVDGAERFIEFFTANIRNPNTRRAYFRAACEFAEWCSSIGLDSLRQVQAVHVAAYIEGKLQILAKPSVKQQLAAIRMLFDFLVVGQIVKVNPASSVRGPKHVVKKGKTPILTADEARQLLDSIGGATPIDRRDRALAAAMVFSFGRVGAVARMRRRDFYYEKMRAWLRLHEKGGKEHTMPAHHKLQEYLEAYIEDLGDAEPASWLFRTVAGRTGKLTDKPMSQSDAWTRFQKRAKAAGIRTRICNHTFRGTGITEYLKNGGKLEVAQQMANHSSARTTKLYDRRDDELSLDEIERIGI